MREAVERLWPELAWIEDAGLREKTLATWVKAFELSPLTPEGMSNRRASHADTPSTTASSRLPSEPSAPTPPSGGLCVVITP